MSYFEEGFDEKHFSHAAVDQIQILLYCCPPPPIVEYEGEKKTTSKINIESEINLNLKSCSLTLWKTLYF